MEISPLLRSTRAGVCVPEDKPSLGPAAPASTQSQKKNSINYGVDQASAALKKNGALDKPSEVTKDIEKELSSLKAAMHTLGQSIAEMFSGVKAMIAAMAGKDNLGKKVSGDSLPANNEGRADGEPQNSVKRRGKRSVNPADRQGLDRPLPQSLKQGQVKAFSPEDLERSRQSKGSKAGDIYGGVAQGQDGHCIFIAGAKAMMDHFGHNVTDVFDKVDRTSNGYNVRLKNGENVSVSDSQLKHAAQNADLKGSDPAMMTTMSFMMAVAGVSAANKSGSQNFYEAFGKLKTGNVAPWDPFTYLGVRHLVREGTVQELHAGKAGILTRGVGLGTDLGRGPRSGHALFVKDNRMDAWGRPGNPVTAAKGIFVFK